MKQEKQTNILKNFTDTLAFLAAVFALITVLLAREVFEPTDEIPKFWQVETTMSYIILGTAFFISAMFSALSRKLPTLALPLSAIPFWFAWTFYDGELLPKRPMLFIILGLVHFAGSLIQVGQWFADSREYTKNTLKSTVTGFFYAPFSLALWLVPIYILSYKWRLQLLPAFYIVVSLGTVSASLGVVWYLLTPKESRKEHMLWNSLTAFFFCLLIWLLRFFLSKLGIRIV